MEERKTLNSEVDPNKKSVGIENLGIIANSNANFENEIDFTDNCTHNQNLEPALRNLEPLKVLLSNFGEISMNIEKLSSKQASIGSEIRDLLISIKFLLSTTINHEDRLRFEKECPKKYILKMFFKFSSQLQQSIDSTPWKIWNEHNQIKFMQPACKSIERSSFVNRAMKQ